MQQILSSPDDWCALTLAPPALVEALRGRYTFERELGRGGMATVYLAYDLIHRSTVALKVLHTELAPHLGGDRFAREIQIASFLKHPNILPVLDAGQANGLPYYVMPYVEGESLAQRLERDGQLPIEDCLNITRQIADALAFAHAQGFVHRDVKPSNILISQNQAILADFGLARAVTLLGDEKLTQSGLAVGTAAYMSPEQASAGKVDARSDIYSLGCVLFEMLTGTPPFTGASAQAILARHVVDPVPSIRTVRPTVSPSLEDVIVKAMAKVPADRYAGAEQLKQAISQADITRSLPVVRRHRRRTLVAVVAGVAALGAAALNWPLSLGRSPALDANRVMVYPLVVPANFTGPRTIGEDVATMIGNALDGTGPLRWIDAWPLLDQHQRQDIRTLSLETARDLARAKRCAYYVTGRLVARDDSAEVFLELNDVRGDSTVARGKSIGSVANVWRTGMQAVNDVLPTLVPGSARDIDAEWKGRDPGAIASFLLGEAAFRRVHLPEALDHYRKAVEADSLFGLAALRGAQAATWNHRSSEAASFIQVAATQQMSPRYAHFTRGYDAFLSGLADSAASEFRRALQADPDMTVAWMQLGEVYTHLLPQAGNPDSLAELAFEEARRLDPETPALLLHLIEIRLRRGEIDKAEPLVRQFLASDPDSTLATQVRIMNTCVRDGPEQVDWQRHASTTPLALLAAGKMLKGGGSHLPCAAQAFTAVLDGDTVGGAWGDSRRWMALVGLQSIYLAQGRIAEATSRVDAGIATGVGGTSLYLLNGSLDSVFSERATAVARHDQIEFGESYAKCPFSNRLWVLGLWEAHAGQAAKVAAIGRELEARAVRTGAAYERLGARAMSAHGALLRGDTAQAIEAFSALLAEPLPDGDLSSDLTAPRGSERLKLAQLLMTRGDFRQAIEVADVFDSAWPVAYTLYLLPSLALRAEAAAAVGDAGLASQYQDRLSALRSSPAVSMR